MKFPSNVHFHLLGLVIRYPSDFILAEEWASCQELSLKMQSSSSSWIPVTKWPMLKKLSVVSVANVIDEHTMPIANGDSFPILREATLILQTFDYQSFVSLVLNSKNLELFNLQLSSNDGIKSFDEEDFSVRLQNLSSLSLRRLYLYCNSNTAWKRPILPFTSLTRLLEKCSDLIQLTYDLTPLQIQTLKERHLCPV